MKGSEQDERIAQSTFYYAGARSGSSNLRFVCICAGCMVSVLWILQLVGNRRATTYIGLDNYVEIWHDSVFWRALKNNVIFVLASVFGQIPLALMLAVILHKSNPLQRFLRSAVFLPMVLSTVVIGMIWQYIYHPQIGILNFLLDALGLESWKLQWLSDDKIAIFSLVPPLLWSFVGLYLIIFISALQIFPAKFMTLPRLTVLPESASWFPFLCP